MGLTSFPAFSAQWTALTNRQMAPPAPLILREDHNFMPSRHQLGAPRMGRIRRLAACWNSTAPPLRWCRCRPGGEPAAQRPSTAPQGHPGPEGEVGVNVEVGEHKSRIEEGRRTSKKGAKRVWWPGRALFDSPTLSDYITE